MKRAFTASILGVGLAQSAAAQSSNLYWQDDFSGYATGTVLNNIGGWTGWDNNSAYAGLVTNALGTNALQVDPALGGPVHEFSGLTSGRWRFWLFQYVPSAFTNDQAYVVINNIYEVPGLKEFAVRMHCDPATGKVVDDLRPEANSIDIVYDRWAEIRFEIDLEADTIDTYYGHTLLSTGQFAIGGGPTKIANINFWTDRFASSPVYYDYMVLENTCYADCDISTGAGVLDIFDFLCFQNAFVSGDPYACDCDTGGHGVCDIFDFLCFQDAFVSGCP